MLRQGGMDGVWLLPAMRREDILTRAWPIFKIQFGEFYLRPPLSDAMKEFATRVGYGPARSAATNSN
jgi:hypothetical protein